MNTYRLGQPEDFLKIPNVSMLTHAYINDAISQATGTILFIYSKDNDLIAAYDVLKDAQALFKDGEFTPWRSTSHIKLARLYYPQDLRIMLEHKILELTNETVLLDH